MTYFDPWSISDCDAQGLGSLACSFPLRSSSQKHVWASPLVTELPSQPQPIEATPSWPAGVWSKQILTLCHWVLVVVYYVAKSLYKIPKGNMTQLEKEWTLCFPSTERVSIFANVKKIHLRFQRWGGRRGHYSWGVVYIIPGSFLRHSNFMQLFIDSHFPSVMVSQKPAWAHGVCPTWVVRCVQLLGLPTHSWFPHLC